MASRWGFSNQAYNAQFYISSGGFEEPEPDHSYGPMGRSGYMIHVVTGGKGLFVSEGQKYELGAGSMFYIEPHKTTYMKADHDDPWTFYWIRFVGNLVPKYMNRINLTAEKPVMNRQDLPQVFDKVIDIVNYSQVAGPHDFYYQAQLFEVLHELQLFYPKEKTALKLPQATDLFQQATRYVANNYETQITVHDLVSYLNIDRSYLYRIFKSQAGVSPQDYITDYRLKKASEILKDPQNSIEYTALSCGFSNYQSFIRFFKKRYQLSPSEYRKQY